MKRYLATLAVLAFGTLPSMGSPTRSGYHSQFHVPPANQPAAAHTQAMNRRESQAAQAKSRQQGRTTAAHIAHATAHDGATSTLGFISATQVPAGGAAYEPASLGDFNGDGKDDLLSLVRNNVFGFPTVVRSHAGNAGNGARAHDGGSDVVSISAVLGNGDGTFKPAVLTTVLSRRPDSGRRREWGWQGRCSAGPPF